MTDVVGAIDAAQIAAIRLAREQQRSSALAGDWDTFMQLCDEQAVVLPPNSPPLESLTAIRAFAVNYPKMKTFTITTSEIDGRIDLAYERGQYEIAAEGFSQRGSHLTLWRKQPDGSWKILRDIWHSDQPA